ncbi:hypothetical protein PanWU01x14_083350 [Parasponia andersonii]|uniref:Uncharacterized protein n=1 Tax=Parasponia andersonii TaxID=3476 RepID=A0A2P5DA60_PARAD|nr:hypothetical protein PanWU01x14_083350 [Parasponia andersonii]
MITTNLRVKAYQSLAIAVFLSSSTPPALLAPSSGRHPSAHAQLRFPSSALSERIHWTAQP